jgi:hypothetical protein
VLLYFPHFYIDLSAPYSDRIEGNGGGQLHDSCQVNSGIFAAFISWEQVTMNSDKLVSSPGTFTSVPRGLEQTMIVIISIYVHLRTLSKKVTTVGLRRVSSAKANSRCLTIFPRLTLRMPESPHTHTTRSLLLTDHVRKDIPRRRTRPIRVPRIDAHAVGFFSHRDIV